MKTSNLIPEETWKSERESTINVHLPCIYAHATSAKTPHNCRPLPATMLRTCILRETQMLRETKIPQTRLLIIYICFQSFPYLHIWSMKYIKRKERNTLPLMLLLLLLVFLLLLLLLLLIFIIGIITLYIKPFVNTPLLFWSLYQATCFGHMDHHQAFDFVITLVQLFVDITF